MPRPIDDHGEFVGPPSRIEETEAQFQKRVIQLAESLGWDWMHIEPMGSHMGWRTPTKGTLRQWPDLVLLRGARMMFLELKAQKAPPPGVDQKRVLQKLSAAAETYTVRPSDWPFLLQELT